MNTNLYTICNSLESQINLFETAGQVSDHFRALALMSSLPKVDWLLCDLPLGDAAGSYSRNLRRVFCEFGGVIKCFRSTLSISDRLHKAGAFACLLRCGKDIDPFVYVLGGGSEG